MDTSVQVNHVKLRKTTIARKNVGDDIGATVVVIFKKISHRTGKMNF